MIARQEACFFEDLIQGSHFLRFFQKQPHRLFKIFQSLVFRSPTGRDVEPLEYARQNFCRP